MLTKGIVTRLELPHEAGQWIDISPLNFRAIRRSREVKSFEQMRMFSKMQAAGGDATGQVMQAVVDQVKPVAAPESTPEIEAAAIAAREVTRRRKAVDLDEYDVQTLLHEGIVAWSYPEKVTPAAIDTLDETTAEYVARHLIPQPESAEERKNA